MKYGKTNISITHFTYKIVSKNGDQRRAVTQIKNPDDKEKRKGANKEEYARKIKKPIRETRSRNTVFFRTYFVVTRKIGKRVRK